MAEGARLLSGYTGKTGIEGSNPSLSARQRFPAVSAAGNFVFPAPEAGVSVDLALPRPSEFPAAARLQTVGLEMVGEGSRVPEEARQPGGVAVDDSGA